jgi:DNA (cytosine-5)-methyltransferase 1
MTAPELLDLFGAAGIGADGYAAAGWRVTSVDVDRAALAHNPHETILRDALDVLEDRAYLSRFDAIHASPPCWRFTQGNAGGKGDKHPDLLTPTLERLRAQDLPWVVENVPRAPMPGALTLCGSEFGLTAWDPASSRRVTLRRHRLFLASFDLWGAGGCTCSIDRAACRIAGVYGGGRADHLEARLVRRGGYAVRDPATAAALLGLERDAVPPLTYLKLAIPPAYGRFIGEQLRKAIA